MRSVVAGPSQVQVPLTRPKGSLLPHNSSSSHTCLDLSRPVIATAAKDGSSDWYSSSINNNSSSINNSSSSGSGDSDRKARSRHYYDSTPRYKDKRSASGEADEQTPAMSEDFADAFADALTTSLGDSRSSSNSSGGGGRGRASSSSNSRGGRGGRNRGVSTADGYIDDLDDEEEDGRGWWEVPREQRSAAAAAAADPTDMDLEPWQQEQLLLAAASSKKKMQVQTVAANTGLDRTEVLAWVAAFRAKPKAEQAKLLAPLQQQIQQLKAQQQAQSNAAQAAEAARRGRSLEQQQQQQPAWQEQEQEQEQELQPRGSPAARQPQGLPFSGKNPDTGFVPYTERRSQAGGKKRLPGEVLRTLEGVYARSPWPNKEVVAGLYDLHRLPRDTVMDWFTARREMDGLPDNPRAAKQLAATARKALDAPQPLLPSELLPPRSQPKQQQQQVAAPASPVGVGAASDASLQQQQQQQQQQQARARVQSITAREMAALRSALPSPRKQKGEKLKQELGIKAGPDSQQVEVSGVTFVVKDGRTGWRKAWKKRRSAAGVPAQQLDFNLWMLRQEQQQPQLQ